MVRGIVEALDEHYIYVFRKSEVDEFSHLKGKVFYFNTFKFSKFNYRILQDIRRVVVIEGITILHLHLDKSLLYGYLLKALYFPTIKIVYHEHGTISGSDMGRNGSRPRWYIPLLNFCSTKIDKYIVIASHIEMLYTTLTKISKYKIVYIGNFIDDKFFNSPSKSDTKNKLSQDEFVVGFAGRLVEGKGCNDFISAVILIAQENKNIKFLLAGEGEEEDEILKQIQQSGLQKRISCLGYVSKMEDFYMMLDCYVAPSHFESVGLTVIEAQAMHIPVVASRISAFEEILEEGVNAIFFDVKDIVGLKERILLVTHKPDLRKKIIENGILNTKKYTKESFLAQLTSLYRTL